MTREPQDRISVIDAASELGQRKQTVFKVMRRLGVKSEKEHHSNHKGQAIAYIKLSDYEKLRDYFETKNPNLDTAVQSSNKKAPFGNGWFYLIQTEPTLAPGRFKVGFASVVKDRLRQHRCSAPFAQLVDQWPCLQKWEQTAIDSVTQGCKKVGTEMFESRSGDLDEVRRRCEKFFEQMPKC